MPKISRSILFLILFPTSVPDCCTLRLWVVSGSEPVVLDRARLNFIREFCCVRLSRSPGRLCGNDPSATEWRLVSGMETVHLLERSQRQKRMLSRHNWLRQQKRVREEPTRVALKSVVTVRDLRVWYDIRLSIKL